jgi:hypothetical protein
MRRSILAAIVILAGHLFAQENQFIINSYEVKLENSYLIISAPDGKEIYRRAFLTPSIWLSDLDNDGVQEIVLIDSEPESGKSSYKIFIYSLFNSVKLIDSISSGYMQPYDIISDELQQTIIITGNPSFNQFNLDSELIFLPLNLWRYENFELYLVNSELYDVFITENESIISFLDDMLHIKKWNCESSLEVLNAIIAAYVNYLNAEEYSIASQLLQKYYVCEDIGKLKNKIDKLIKEGELHENGME